MWRASIDPAVVTARAVLASPSDPDAIDLSALGTERFVVSGACDQRHIVLFDGLHRLRLDVVGAVDLGPIVLHYDLAGMIGVDAKLHTIRRLLALVRLGRFARGLEEHLPRAERQMAMLRAHDLQADGASQRDIAIALFWKDRVNDEWRTTSDSLRLRVQRLCRDAAGMIDGGYLKLLSGSGQR